MSETLENSWSTPAALAIPKEGYFKKEEGRFGPIYPRTPACYGFSVVAKVIPGREQAIRDYGPLEPIARNSINVAKIATQWPDMLRVAGSLVTNQVRAYDLLRMFGRDGHPTPLGQAFIEYGRIAKTLHLLALVDPIDGTYQRRMNRQLTVQESRHRLGRKICHGNRGTILRKLSCNGRTDIAASADDQRDMI